jgi:hypothetical protein
MSLSVLPSVACSHCRPLGPRRDAARELAEEAVDRHGRGAGAGLQALDRVGKPFLRGRASTRSRCAALESLEA